MEGSLRFLDRDDAKPDEIARPSQRKAKHKRPPSDSGDEGL